MKRQFCLPCFLELKKAGKHNIQRVGGGVNMKITCWRCKRRRYLHILNEMLKLLCTVSAPFSCRPVRLAVAELYAPATGRLVFPSF